MTNRNQGHKGPQRYPNAAMGMSLVLPGLGQLYNGESRKGMLFMIVGVLNYLCIICLIMMGSILQRISSFAAANHIQPNIELLTSMSDLHFPSAASILLCGLFISFAAYSARDAFERASHLQRRALYHDYALEMTEATSGS